jgi:hypothetical protein
MMNDIVLARIFGILLLVAGGGVLMNIGYYENVISDLMENRGSMYLGGILALLTGLVIVSFHNKWSLDTGIILTLLGWAALLKGMFIILAPGLMASFSEKVLGSRKLLVSLILLLILAGGILTAGTF